VRILYVAPYVSEGHLRRHPGFGVVSLAGQRKMELVWEALANGGHEVRVLSSAVPSESRLRWRRSEQEVVSCGPHAIPIHYPGVLELRPLGGMVNALLAPRLVDELGERANFDVLWLYNTYLFEYRASRGRSARAKTPIVVEVEDLPLARRREWGNLKPLLDQRCWARALQEAAAFTAVNSEILGLLPSERPAALLPGIVDGGLMARGRARSPAFTGQRRRLGYFGGLSEEKGVGVLLEVLPRLPGGWELVVCGSGPMAPRFGQAARAQPERLRFLGTVPLETLHLEMCGCDATLVPAERISGAPMAVFPFKVLEYLSAGTHVVSPPLPLLAGLDLEFVQRWDGGVETLVQALNGAERAYREEAPHRLRALQVIVERFGTKGVEAALSRLLQQAVAR